MQTLNFSDHKIEATLLAYLWNQPCSGPMNGHLSSCPLLVQQLCLAYYDNPCTKSDFLMDNVLFGFEFHDTVPTAWGCSSTELIVLGWMETKSDSFGHLMHTPDGSIQSIESFAVIVQQNLLRDWV